MSRIDKRCRKLAVALAELPEVDRARVYEVVDRLLLVASELKRGLPESVEDPLVEAIVTSLTTGFLSLKDEGGWPKVGAAVKAHLPELSARLEVLLMGYTSVATGSARFGKLPEDGGG